MTSRTFDESGADLDDAADDAAPGDDAVVAVHAVLCAAIDRHDVRRRLGIVADHRRSDPVGMRELRAREILRRRNAREPFLQLVVLREQPRRSRCAAARSPTDQPGRANERVERAAHAADDRRRGELKIRAHRRHGHRERRGSTCAREVELKQRDESGHDDRPDYRE